MILRVGAFFLLMGISSAQAACDPWIARNESYFVSNANNTNLPTAHLGLVGEADLPYTVPAGKRLTIKYLAIEAIWGVAMWPWIGTNTFGGDGWSDSQVLNTFTAQPHPATPTSTNPAEGHDTAQWTPTYVLPEGLTFNLTMKNFNAPSGDWIYGWEVSGELCDAN